MKHQIARVFAIVAVSTAFFTFTEVRSAHAACTILDITGGGLGSVNLVIGHSVTWTPIYPDGTVPPPYPLTLQATGTLEYFFLLSGSHLIIVDNDTNNCGNVPLPLFNDGRENKFDALQTAAVYCGVPHDGDVRVYALFNNVGSIAFTVTKAELADGVQKPATPYLIKSAKGAELWRLQDGSLRIKRGTYVFDWPGC